MPLSFMSWASWAKNAENIIQNSIVLSCWEWASDTKVVTYKTYWATELHLLTCLATETQMLCNNDWGAEFVKLINWVDAQIQSCWDSNAKQQWLKCWVYEHDKLSFYSDTKLLSQTLIEIWPTELLEACKNSMKSYSLWNTGEGRVKISENVLKTITICGIGQL